MSFPRSTRHFREAAVQILMRFVNEMPCNPQGWEFIRDDIPGSGTWASDLRVLLKDVLPTECCELAFRAHSLWRFRSPRPPFTLRQLLLVMLNRLGYLPDTWTCVAEEFRKVLRLPQEELKAELALYLLAEKEPE